MFFVTLSKIVFEHNIDATGFGGFLDLDLDPVQSNSPERTEAIAKAKKICAYF